VTEIAISPGAADLDILSGRNTPLQRVQRVLHNHPSFGPFVVLAVSFVIFGLINSRFFSATNISLMLQQVAVVAALGVAQTLVILTAGIDLSIGAAMIVGQMIMAQTAANDHVAAPLALLLGFSACMVIGGVLGILVTRFRLPPFIASLGALSILGSVGLLYSNGQSIQSTQMPHLLNWTGDLVNIGPFQLTNGVILMLGLYLVVGYMLAKTAWGRHVYAVGDDRDAARLAGIRTRYVLLAVWVFAGLLIGIAAWISIGYTGAASPNNAAGELNLQSIVAVVIGGTSLFGGRGVLLGTLFGALIVVVFTSGLTLANVNDLYQPIAEGVLVIAAVGIDQWIRGVK
jgi:fructose transport system permease protein